MSAEGTDLISQLDIAYSREEGLALLRSNPNRLSDALAETLSARAKELKISGETVLSEDFSAWASETRSLVTLQLAMSAKSDQAKVEFLQNQQDRFDDAFYDLCSRITSDRLFKIYALMEAPKAGKAAIDSALEEATGHVELLTAIGKIADNHQFQAKTGFLLGTLLLFRSQWETLQGQTSDASKTATEAKAALERRQPVQSSQPTTRIG